MSLSVGELYVKLGIDMAEFNRALGQVDAKLNALGKQGAGGFTGIQGGATGATGALNGLGIAAGVAGAAMATAAVAGATALGAALTGAINTAATFESQMSAIKAVMQPTAAQFDALSAKARELGATTSFSATEAAMGIEMLAKNGVTYDDIMGGVLDSTLALAAATGTDLALSADIATDVMAAFGMTAGEMGTVVNGITGVLTASKFGIDDYRLALANGGAAASAFGVSLDDFNTVIAVTSSQFASGQTAGTAFRTFINRLTPSTQPAIDAMRQLGIITADGTNQFYDSTGALKDMDEVMKILQSTMGGLSEADLAANIETIFGAEAIGTVIGLLNATDEQYKAVQNTIANASAEDQAAERLNNFNGALEMLKSALEGAAIALGTPFLGPLTNLVNGVASAIGSFTQFADSILRAGNPLQALILAIDSVIPGFAQLANEAFVWGQNITVQFSNGIVSAMAPLVNSLKQIGSVIQSWLKPGSPPAITPGLDQWGAEAATVYFDGWAQGDYSAFQQIGNTIEQTLRGMISAGLSSIPEEGIIPTIMGSQSALGEAISQFREFGSVSEDAISNVVNSVGEAGPQIEGLIRAYFDLETASRAVADAQAELNAVTEEYNQKLAPLTEEMKALKERQQEIRDMKRLEELNKKLADEKTSEHDKELARLEIAEIQLRQQIDAVEEERDTAVDAAQVKLDAAKEQEAQAKLAFDAQKAQLQFYNDQNALITKQTELLTRLAEEAQRAAEAATGGGGGAGGLGGGLALPAMPEMATPEEPSVDRQAVTDVYEANAQAVNNYIQQVQLAQQRERESTPIVQMLSGAFQTMQGVLAPLGSVFTGVIVPAITQVSNIVSTTTLPLLQRLGSAFSTAFVSNGSSAVSSFANVVTVVAPIISAAIDGVMGTINGLIGMLTGMLPGAAMITQGVFNALSNVVTTFSGMFLGVVDIIANLIAGNWSGAWEAAKNVVSIAFEGIKNGISNALTIAIGIVSTIIGGIVGFFDGAYQTLTGNTSTFSDSVTGFFNTLKDNAVTAVENLYDDAKTKFEELYTTVTTTVSDFASEAVTTVETFKTDVVTAVTNIATDIGNLASEFLDKAKAIGTEVINGIISGLVEAAGKLYNKVRDIIKNAIGAGEEEGDIQSPSGETERRIGIPLVQGIIAGMNAMIGDLHYSMATMITDLIDDAEKLTTELTDIFNNMARHVLEATRSLGSIQIGIIDDVSNLFKFSADDAIDSATSRMNKFGEEYNKLRDSIDKRRVDDQKAIEDSIRRQSDLEIAAADKVSKLRETLSEKLKDFAADETNPEVIERRNKLIRDTEKEIADIQRKANDEVIAEQNKRAQITKDLFQFEKDTAFLMEQAHLNEITAANEMFRLNKAQERQRAIALQAEKDIAAVQAQAAEMAKTDPAQAARFLDLQRKQIVELAKLDQDIALAQARRDDREIARLEAIRAATIKNHKIDRDLLAMTDRDEDAKAAAQMRRLQEITEEITALFGSGNFISIGQDVANGITNGIMQSIGSVSTALAAGFNAAITDLKRLLGIRSPSKLFAQEIAKPSIQGWAMGLEQFGGMISQSVGSVGMQSVSAIPQQSAPIMAGETYIINMDLSGSNLTKRDVESILDTRLDKITSVSRVVKRT